MTHFNSSPWFKLVFLDANDQGLAVSSLLNISSWLFFSLALLEWEYFSGLQTLFQKIQVNWLGGKDNLVPV